MRAFIVGLIIFESAFILILWLGWIDLADGGGSIVFILAIAVISPCFTGVRSFSFSTIHGCLLSYWVGWEKRWIISRGWWI